MPAGADDVFLLWADAAEDWQRLLARPMRPAVALAWMLLQTYPSYDRRKQMDLLEVLQAQAFR